MLFSLCACESDNQPTDTNSADTQSATVSKNEYNGNKEIKTVSNADVELLTNSNIDELQGKIEAYYENYSFCAFKVGNKLYEYYSMDIDDDKNLYVCYDLGECASIVSYGETAIVVERIDGTVEVLVPINKDNEQHTAELITFTLDCLAAEDIQQCKANEQKEWMYVVYTQNNNVYYTLYSLNGTTISTGKISDIMDEQDKAYGLNDFVQAEENELFALNDKSELRTFELSPMYLQSSNKYVLKYSMKNYGFEPLTNVDKWIQVAYDHRFVVSHNGDDQKLHFYERVETENGFETKFCADINIPTGYTTEDIVAHCSVSNSALIRFSDGEYYYLQYMFTADGPEGEPEWYKLSGFTKVAENSVVSSYGPWIGMLTDGGEFYTYSTMFEFDE